MTVTADRIQSLRTEHPNICWRPDGALANVCLRDLGHVGGCGWEAEHPAGGGAQGDALDEWASWALDHLPSNARGYLTKAQHEWAELLDDPGPEEAVDVVMCLAAFVKAMGLDPGAWVRAKHEINRERTWTLKPDGTWQHVDA